MKYLLLNFDCLNDSEEKGWALLQVSSQKPVDINEEKSKKKFRVLRMVKASENFDSAYNTENDRDEGMPIPGFLPHLESDGKIYVTAHFNIVGGNNDRLFECDSDADAILLAEVEA